MLRKTQRLTKRDFEVYFKEGKRHHSPTLQLIYTPHSNFHSSIVVPKKVCKSAVARNRLRRQLYSVLYGISNTQTGVFIVIVKKPESITVLRNDLRKLISRVAQSEVE